MKARVLSILCNLHIDESGQDLVEYAMAAALIAFGSITSMSSLAGNINTSFSKIGSAITSAIS
jgi:pilus assembly protein Flp/PilA